MTLRTSNIRLEIDITLFYCLRRVDEGFISGMVSIRVMLKTPNDFRVMSTKCSIKFKVFIDSR